MVSHRLGSARRACRSALRAGALTLALACRRETGGGEEAVGGSADSRIAELVRRRYAAGDAVAAGAWVWTAPDSVTYVFIDAQSTIPGLVQARAELWLANERDAALYGRSETLPSASELGAYQFEDLNADGVPDFFGYVADSSGARYPVFFAGSRPGMTEEIALSASGWRFATDEDHEPTTYGKSGSRTCALQLWADEAAPDGLPPGPRFLAIFPDGKLGAPTAVPPVCSADGAGVQRDTLRP